MHRNIMLLRAVHSPGKNNGILVGRGGQVRIGQCGLIAESILYLPLNFCGRHRMSLRCGGVWREILRLSLSWGWRLPLRGRWRRLTLLCCPGWSRKEDQHKAHVKEAFHKDLRG